MGLIIEFRILGYGAYYRVSGLGVYFIGVIGHGK